jgi:HSP20 family protein
LTFYVRYANIAVETMDDQGSGGPDEDQEAVRMTVLRFDPFRELDRLADQAWGRSRTALPMDAYRRSDELVLEFDLPGVDPSSVDVTVEKNVLAITAERPTSRHEGDEVIVAQRPTGRFARKLQLGDGLDTEQVRASYVDGVLTVTFPVAAEIRPRRVTVQTAVAGAPEAAGSEAEAAA